MLLERRADPAIEVEILLIVQELEMEGQVLRIVFIDQGLNEGFLVFVRRFVAPDPFVVGT